MEFVPPDTLAKNRVVVSTFREMVAGSIVTVIAVVGSVHEFVEIVVDQYYQNRKTSHRASFFKFAHADSLWLSCNFDPKDRKLYRIMPSGLHASIWSRGLAHAGALHKPTYL
jgi:hypothetical protein